MPDPTGPADPSDPASRPLHLGVLLFTGAEPLDAVGPAQVLWTLEPVRPFLAPFAPTRVHLVAERAGPVVLGHGFVVYATVGYEDCPPLDVLVVPGGSGSDEGAGAGPAAGRHHFERHEPTLEFIRRQASGALVTASVCTGTFLLAGAGLLAGRRATTHWSARDELVARMAERGEPFTLEAARVVEDGPVVSGGGVSSGIDATLHVVGRVFGEQIRDAVALGIEIETPGAA